MYKLAVEHDTDYWHEHGLPDDGCFGYIGDTLMLGKFHHQAIMAKLIDAGWTWEDLMESPQAWGWFSVNSNRGFINLSFTSDAGLQHPEEVEKAKKAFEEKYHLPTRGGAGSKGVSEESYGRGLRGKQHADYWLSEVGLKRLQDFTDAPPPPSQNPIDRFVDFGQKRRKEYEEYPFGKIDPPLIDEFLKRKDKYKEYPFGKIEPSLVDKWIEQTGYTPTLPPNIPPKGTLLTPKGYKKPQYKVLDVDPKSKKILIGSISGNWSNIYPFDNWNEWQFEDWAATKVPEPVNQGQSAPTIGAPTVGMKVKDYPHQQLPEGTVVGSNTFQFRIDKNYPSGAYSVSGRIDANDPWKLLNSNVIMPVYQYFYTATIVEVPQTIETTLVNIPLVGTIIQSKMGGQPFLISKVNPDGSIGLSHTKDGFNWSYLGDWDSLEKAFNVSGYNIIDVPLWTSPNKIPKPAPIKGQPKSQDKFYPNEIGAIPPPGTSFTMSGFATPFTVESVDNDNETITLKNPSINPTAWHPTYEEWSAGWVPKIKQWIGQEEISSMNDLENLPAIGTDIGLTADSGNKYRVKYIDPVNKTISVELKQDPTLHWEYPFGHFNEIGWNKTWLQNSSSVKYGKWDDIMDKAQRLRDEGNVQILRNGSQNIVGQVTGDHGTYNTEIWRDDPDSQAMTMWNCDCDWGDHSWGRTRIWKKYEGRPCSHTLALWWEAQGQPVDDQEQAPQAPAAPISPVPQQQGPISPIGPGAFQSLPVQPEPMPQGGPMPEQQPEGPPSAPPAQSQITTPQTIKSPLDIPGAFSKVADYQGHGQYLGSFIYFDGRFYWDLFGTHYNIIADQILGSGDIYEASDWNEPAIAGWMFLEDHKLLIKFASVEFNNMHTELMDDALQAAKETMESEVGRIDEVVNLPLTHPYKQPWWAKVATPAGWQAWVYDLGTHTLYGPGQHHVKIVPKIDNGSFLEPEHRSFSDLIFLNSHDGIVELDEGFGPRTEGTEEALQALRNRLRLSKVAQYTEGDKVRARYPLFGEDVNKTPYIVPISMAGEVLTSDQEESVVIFPLPLSGSKEPHLIKVICQNDELYLDEKVNPFVKKRGAFIKQEAIELPEMDTFQGALLHPNYPFMWINNKLYVGPKGRYHEDCYRQLIDEQGDKDWIEYPQVQGRFDCEGKYRIWFEQGNVDKSMLEQAIDNYLSRIMIAGSIRSNKIAGSTPGRVAWVSDGKNFIFGETNHLDLLQQLPNQPWSDYPWYGGLITDNDPYWQVIYFPPEEEEEAKALYPLAEATYKSRIAQADSTQLSARQSPKWLEARNLQLSSSQDRYSTWHEDNATVLA